MSGKHAQERENHTHRPGDETRVAKKKLGLRKYLRKHFILHKLYR